MKYEGMNKESHLNNVHPILKEIVIPMGSEEALLI